MIRFLIILTLLPLSVLAGPTKVGNGDDGADLEKTQKVESGILISTRNQALKLLEQLNVRAIPGLGTLPDELKNAEIYIVQNDITTPKNFDTGMETSPDGKMVYARTFARPYSPVRFFPAALTLSEEQLVRLHIHEALHRSLAKEIRENESIVSQITLAITSPTASRDALEDEMKKYQEIESSGPVGSQSYRSSAVLDVKPTKRLLAPSVLRLSYEVFDLDARETDLYPLNNLTRLDSFLYPFGSPTNSLGLGITMSYVTYGENQQMGPLQVSGRQILNTWRGFDVEAFVEYAMYSFSEDDMKNISQARDVGVLGLSLRKESETFYTENFLSLTLGSEKEFKLGNVSYIQDYSPIINARIGAGFKKNSFFVGGHMEISLTDGSSVRSSSNSFESSKQRVSLYTVGPEMGYINGNFQFSVYGRAILNRKSQYNLSNLGNILNHGAGQGFIGTSLAYNY